MNWDRAELFLEPRRITMDGFDEPCPRAATSCKVVTSQHTSK